MASEYGKPRNDKFVGLAPSKSVILTSKTRRKHTETDGVGVIAILSGPDMPPSLLLQKQFRPPLNKCTIEVPSGLIDEGEDIATAALRELKEETGYIATIAKSDSAPSADSTTTATLPKSSDPVAESDPTGFIMHNDPGFCNTNTRMLFVDVDLTDPANQIPVPELEENEYIETFTLPLKGLWDELRKLDREGFGIDARVATLAQGWEMARRWKGELD